MADPLAPAPDRRRATAGPHPAGSAGRTGRRIGHVAGRPLVIELTPAPGMLTIAMRPVEAASLDDCRQVLDRLVGAVEVERDGEGLVLRAG